MTLPSLLRSSFRSDCGALAISSADSSRSPLRSSAEITGGGRRPPSGGGGGPSPALGGGRSSPRPPPVARRGHRDHPGHVRAPGSLRSWFSRGMSTNWNATVPFRVDRVVDRVLLTANLVGEAVAARLGTAKSGDLRPAERGQCLAHRIGAGLRVDLPAALGDLAVEAAVEVRIGLRGVVVIVRSGRLRAR